eukprot:TRINITY_DN7222_c0_g1_i1.p1 TRINITY_DN7222_c0_g1~~TRINITY_DN7222_c0_g1_i1.p1  ORF type:complete len:212 (-),score=50.28 TRINITY_DN7222_c0_g1_i1:144-779(-)
MQGADFDAKGEVRLATNNKERELMDDMANLFSIIKTLEHLEAAYVRDSCTPAQYTTHCEKLLGQYGTASKLLGPDFTLRQFMLDYRLDCPAAAHRIEVGVPITIEHKSDKGGASISHVAEATQAYITAMDGLQLERTAADQLQPLLCDLVAALEKLTILPREFDGLRKTQTWLEVVNKMKASEELSEEQARQLTFDLENSYNNFLRYLQSS